MIWEKMYLFYVRYIVPIFVFAISVLYMSESLNYSLVLARTELGFILFILMSIFPVMFHALDSFFSKKYIVFSISVTTLGLMMFILIRELLSFSYVLSTQVPPV